MTELLAQISRIIVENSWFAPILALTAGVLTSFTPCSLSGIPLVIGYVSGTGQRDTKRAFGLSVTFALGSAVTFTSLRVADSLAGQLIGTSSSLWFLALGVLMVLMALQTMEIFTFIPSSFLLSKSTKTGFIGAFLAGILAGVFSSPCATPVLVALLAIVAGHGSILWGAWLLLLYSVGHGVLAVAAGTSVGLVKKISADPAYGKASVVIKYTMGVFILLIGLYMFYLGF